MMLSFPLSKRSDVNFLAANAAKIRTHLSYRFFSNLSTDKKREKTRKTGEKTQKTEKKAYCTLGGRGFCPKTDFFEVRQFFNKFFIYLPKKAFTYL